MSELICLLTGISDVELEDLAGLTPLQKAHTPELDRRAKKLGVKQIDPPLEGDVESALLALLDIEAFVPRGFAQAYARGITLAPTQRAYAMRLSSCGEGVLVDVSDELVRDSEGRALCQALNQGLGSKGCSFLHLHGAEAVLVTSDPSLKQLPLHTGRNPVDLLGTDWRSAMGGDAGWFCDAVEACLQAHEINSMREDLEERPINALVLCDGGERPQFDAAPQTGLLISARGNLQGAARLAGMQIRSWPTEARRFDGITGVLARLPQDIEEYERVIIDVPYVWDSTYKGDLLEKIKTIEWLDNNFIPRLPEQTQLLPLRRCDIRLGRTIDGSVPCICASGESQETYN